LNEPSIQKSVPSSVLELAKTLQDFKKIRQAQTSENFNRSSDNFQTPAADTDSFRGGLIQPSESVQAFNRSATSFRSQDFDHRSPAAAVEHVTGYDRLVSKPVLGFDDQAPKGFDRLASTGFDQPRPVEAPRGFDRLASTGFDQPRPVEAPRGFDRLASTSVQGFEQPRPVEDPQEFDPTVSTSEQGFDQPRPVEAPDSRGLDLPRPVEASKSLQRLVSNSDQPQSVEVPSGFDQPRPVEAPRGFDQPRQVEGPRGFDQPRPVEALRGFDQPRPVDAPRGFDPPRPVEAPRGFDQQRPVEAPRGFDQPQPVEAPRGFDRPLTVEAQSLRLISKSVLDQPRPVEAPSIQRSNFTRVFDQFQPYETSEGFDRPSLVVQPRPDEAPRGFDDQQASTGFDQPRPVEPLRRFDLLASTSVQGFNQPRPGEALLSTPTIYNRPPPDKTVQVFDHRAEVVEPVQRFDNSDNLPAEILHEFDRPSVKVRFFIFNYSELDVH
jgi:hypothetical protein